VEHRKGASLGQALALATNIRLRWKGFAGTNALAYYEKSELAAVNCFITLARFFYIREPKPLLGFRSTRILNL
jgi:hypothetical protein